MKFLSIIGIILLCACNKEVTTPIPPEHTITFTIDSALNSDGTKSLIKDNNGFYHLSISQTSNQTLSRITGRFLVDGKPNAIPSPIEYTINWESDHFWVLKAGDTVGRVIQTYFNPFTGTLQNVKLPSLVAKEDVIIPVINGVSNSDFKNGSVNAMLAPVFKMKGDTINVVGKINYSIEIPVDNLFSKIKRDSIQESIRIICD